MKVYLQKVRLNQGGYDAHGRYWGVGMPLYWYCTEDCEHDSHIRAFNREDAKLKVRQVLRTEEVEFFK